MAEITETHIEREGEQAKVEPAPARADRLRLSAAARRALAASDADLHTCVRPDAAGLHAGSPPRRSCSSARRPPVPRPRASTLPRVKIEATFHGDRKVFTSPRSTRGSGSTCAGSRGLGRGRSDRAAAERRLGVLFFTLGSAERASGARCSAALRHLELELLDGERVLVEGRSQIYEAKGELELPREHDRENRLGRSSRGDRAAEAGAGGGGALRRPTANGHSRGFHGRSGIVTGADAAAQGDVVTAIRSRFPAAPSSSPRRVSRARAGRRSPPRSVGLRPIPPSTLSSSPAAAGASRISCPSATRPSCVRSRPAPFPSSRPWATSRTRLSAISPPTSAPRPRRPRPSRRTRSGGGQKGLDRLRDLMAGSVRRAIQRDRERLKRSRDRLHAAPLLLLDGVASASTMPPPGSRRSHHAVPSPERTTA